MEKTNAGSNLIKNSSNTAAITLEYDKNSVITLYVFGHFYYRFK